MFLEVFEIVSRNLRDILFDVREWIGYILIAPETRVQQNVQDCLLLYQHLTCLILDSLWNLCSLLKVDSIGRWLPIVLHGCVMRRADIWATGVWCLHDISQHRSHVKVLWQQENVREVLDSCSVHRYWHCWLADLLKHELEYVLHVV